jgi:dimethylhistidine N-methyltransferase
MARAAPQKAIPADELDEIIDGLSQSEKMISPKYFYDERGSQLFDEITRLPEYYPTETELGIMRAHIDEIASLVGKHASLIEFGSGSSLKTRVLLEHMDELAVYVPVDISEDHLLDSARQIRTEFPGLEVLPVVADFTQEFQLPSPTIMPVRNVVYFPGSTIGNFTHEAAHELLKVMHHEAGEGGALLIGVDLQKDSEIIRRAYNDVAGVTAKFNLNMLRHLNREFDTDFDLDAFEHSAEYNEEKGRVEVRLVSDQDQEVTVGDTSFSIDKDEAILTEYSHKYTLDGFAAMAKAAGFNVERVWMDAECLFSVQYLVRD